MAELTNPPLVIERVRTSYLEFRTADPPELAVDGVHLLHQGSQDGVVDPLGGGQAKRKAEKSTSVLLNPRVVKSQDLTRATKQLNWFGTKSRGEPRW